MLRLVNLEEIQKYLQEIPKLIDLLSKGDSRFVQDTKKWFVEIETIFNSNKIPEVGKIASLRGTVISAEMGITPDRFNAFQLTKSKIRNGVTLDALKQANDIVFNFIQKDIDSFSEAERIMSQVISVSKSKGILSDFPSPPITADILKFYWIKLSNDSDLLPGVVSIEGLVGPYDSLIIFNRLVKTS
jgi:hypothetical protein